MLTEKQKECGYCNFPAGERGWDFGADSDWFQIYSPNNTFYIGAWGVNRDDVVRMDSVGISYCPMCGRKLTKE